MAATSARQVATSGRLQTPCVMARLLPFEIGERRVPKGEPPSMRPSDRGEIGANTREDGRGRLIRLGDRGSLAKGGYTMHGIHARSQEGT